MSNFALVRISVLRFVIPYASTKVNNYAMKLYPTCGALSILTPNSAPHVGYNFHCMIIDFRACIGNHKP